MKRLSVRECMTPFLVVSVYFALGAAQAWSQAPPTPGPPAAAQSAPPAGITNGTPPIESTILAYKILVADAAKIDESLSAKTTGKIVIDGTNTDIAAIM